MKTKGVPDETDEAVADNDAEQMDPCVPAAKKIVGLIFTVVLIFLAQRDLRSRPAELVRGNVRVWKVAAMVGPGAVAYLVFGRRRSAPTVLTLDLVDS
jgi:hypothetical protein